jgi:hypothetical protein
MLAEREALEEKTVVVEKIPIVHTAPARLEAVSTEAVAVELVMALITRVLK